MYTPIQHTFEILKRAREIALREGVTTEVQDLLFDAEIIADDKRFPLNIKMSVTRSIIEIRKLGKR